MRALAYLGRLGEKRKFLVDNAQCVGCLCFEPLVLIESGNRSQSREHNGCRDKMTGHCPSWDQREYTEAREKRRRAEGWIDRV